MPPFQRRRGRLKPRGLTLIGWRRRCWRRLAEGRPLALGSRVLFSSIHRLDHRVIKHIKHGLPHAFADIDKQRRGERGTLLIAGEPACSRQDEMDTSCCAASEAPK